MKVRGGVKASQTFRSVFHLVAIIQRIGPARVRHVSLISGVYIRVPEAQGMPQFMSQGRRAKPAVETGAAAIVSQPVDGAEVGGREFGELTRFEHEHDLVELLLRGSTRIEVDDQFFQPVEDFIGPLSLLVRQWFKGVYVQG